MSTVQYGTSKLAILFSSTACIAPLSPPLAGSILNSVSYEDSSFSRDSFLPRTYTLQNVDPSAEGGSMWVDSNAESEYGWIQVQKVSMGGFKCRKWQYAQVSNRTDLVRFIHVCSPSGS
jgi:hypothetical protein